MKRNKRKKLNLFKILMAIFLFILLIFLLVLIVFKVFIKPVQNKEILMLDIVGMDIKEANLLLSEYELDINTEYKYSDEILKDKIISQSIVKDMVINKGDKLDLIVILFPFYVIIFTFY